MAHDSQSKSMTVDTPQPARCAGAGLAVVGLAALLIVLRVGGFSDLYDNAQPGPIAHTIDITVNGQWLMQREPSGETATKPPLYPWITAICVKVIGRTDEWVFKLPIIVSFLGMTWLVWDLARRSLGTPWGCVAAAFWIANAHVFKLAYTARTDMMLTLWIVLGVWSEQLQREHWAPEAPVRRGRSLGLIAVFWLSVGLGLLTKGPPALLSVAWLVGVIAWDRAWKRCRMAWQVIGLLAASGMMAAWLVPALRAYPSWQDNIRREVTERITGEGSGSRRHTPLLAMPAYFLGRFFPWSVLCVIGAITWRKLLKGRGIGWTFGWIALVIGVFMIPKGKRADYILPSYAAGAVLAAAMVQASVRAGGRLSKLIGVLLGTTGLAAIVGPLVVLWLNGMPESVTLSPLEAEVPITIACGVIVVSGLTALAGAGLVLAWAEPESYATKSIAASLAILGILGIYQNTLSPAAESRAGDYIRGIVDEVRELHNAHPTRPIVFHDVGKTPIQALLNNNDMERADKLNDVVGGSILVTSLRAWERNQDMLIDRARLVMQTPELPESETAVILAVIDPDRSTGSAE